MKIKLTVFSALAGLALSLSGMQRAGAASFVDARSMHNARAHHTATLLADGRVLVAGGWRALTAAELYDPATDRWTTTGALNDPRAGATAILLANGKVLVLGGVPQGGSYWSSTSAELYDPATGSWSPTRPMTHARLFASATLLAGGEVLVGTTELYDPASGNWTETVQPSQSVRSTTLLPNGKVFGAAALYDPDTGTWTSTSAASEIQDGHPTLLLSGEVLVTGGGPDRTLASLYDFKSGTWTGTGSMIEARSGPPPTLLPDGKVLVLRGNREPTANLYDPISGTWEPTASMRVGRMDFTATLLPNGQVLVVGGRNESWLEIVSSAELYVPDYLEAAPSLNILYHSNQIMSFSWHGVGTLQQSDNLTDWQAARRHDNPQTILTTNAPMKFFRVNSTP